MKVPKAVKRGELIEVHWEDSSGLKEAWLDPNLELEVPHIITCGYFVRASKRSLMLVMGAGENGQAHGVFLIPLGCVKHISKIRR